MKQRAGEKTGVELSTVKCQLPVRAVNRDDVCDHLGTEISVFQRHPWPFYKPLEDLEVHGIFTCHYTSEVNMTLDVL